MKRRTFLRNSAIVGGALAAYPIVGCGDDDDDDDSGSAPGGGTTPTAAASPTPSKPTGTLKVAHASFGNDTFDAHFARATANTVMYYPIYANLTGQDLERRDVPEVAERWETPDTNTWIFKLRPDVKDHQGNKVTADVIIWNLKLFQTKAPTSITGASMESADAPDELTVRIKTKTPVAIGAQHAGGFGEMRIYSMKAFETMGEDNFYKAPVGTGPFAFESRSPGEFVKFKAFNDYFKGAPRVEKLEFYLVPEQTTRVAQLRTGQVDMISAIAGTAVDELEAVRNIKLTKLEDSAWLVFQPFDVVNEKSPLKDARVRQAINYAVDKEGLVKGIYRGRGKPAPYGFFSPITNGYVANHEQWKYDPAKAKALLKEAGFENGFSLGDMAVSELSQFPLAPALIEAVNNNLRAVGIQAPLKPIEYGAYIQAVRDGKLTSLTYMASNNLADLALGLPVWMRSTSVFSAIKDPAVDADIAAQAAEVDPAKRTVILQRLFNVVNKTPWAVFTVSPDAFLATTDKVGPLPQPKATAYIQNLHLVSKSA